ncbi:MAG: hypothetical protein LAO55_22005 [Acidobacteriia bacterium]|nr:hypothetical protein [Terriglobia bacterium]
MQRIFTVDEIPSVSVEADSAEDFELVVGRRQVAAITFLGLVIVVVCSGGAYLAGKAMSAREEPIQPMIQVEPAAPLPAPSVAATIAPPADAPALKPAVEAPLFASPVPKAIYIQVGAVEKGVGIILVEGLRKHALDSFAAPGPSEKTFRVLIGPFADAETYQKARNIVDQIGLSNFARRYQQQ